MKIKILRKDFAADFTISDVLVNDKFECYCIEDTVRAPDQPKVPGKTAIPYGTYDLIVNMSNRFKKDLPLLLDVPNFAGIRIHTGNTSVDTEGCLIPGKIKQKGRVLQSREAFNALFDKIKAAIANGEKVTVEVTKGEIQNFV